jgi:hypothetical protein
MAENAGVQAGAQLGADDACAEALDAAGLPAGGAPGASAHRGGHRDIVWHRRRAADPGLATVQRGRFCSVVRERSRATEAARDEAADPPTHLQSSCARCFSSRADSRSAPRRISTASARYGPQSPLSSTMRMYRKAIVEDPARKSALPLGPESWSSVVWRGVVRCCGLYYVPNSLWRLLEFSATCLSTVPRPAGQAHSNP